MFLLVRGHQDLNHLLKQGVSVRTPTVRTLVLRGVGIELYKFAFNALGHDLSANYRIREHPITVDVDEHGAPTALDHLLASDDLLANSHHTLRFIDTCDSFDGFLS